MPSRVVTVGSKIGLHARPAAVIAKAATATGVPVILSKDGAAPVDAGSALLIMTLDANYGDRVTVECDDEAAMQKIADLIETDLA